MTSCDILAVTFQESLGWIQAALGAVAAPRQMNITERASKAEIISAAVELTDSQAHEIGALKEERTLLYALLGVLAALHLLF